MPHVTHSLARLRKHARGLERLRHGLRIARRGLREQYQLLTPLLDRAAKVACNV